MNWNDRITRVWGALERMVRSIRPGAGGPADFRGKVAVVTGGSRGLGFLLARELGRQGCRVAICARDAQELERARTRLAAEGIEVFAQPCDVSVQSDVERFITATTARYGQVDVLVNNAGIIEAGPVRSMTIDDFRTTMDTMFWGALYPTWAVMPAMIERRQGWIVTIASIGGKVSVPHLLPYSAAKFAAVGLSEGLRAELARNGVSVTTVVPGLLRTGSFLQAMFKGDPRKEYGWFAILANTPGISMDAERAARLIVNAARRGDAELTLTLPASFGARFHGLFPGVTADLLGLVNRILPESEGRSATAYLGKELDQRIHSRLFEILTAFGRSAAKRFNE